MIDVVSHFQDVLEISGQRHHGITTSHWEETQEQLHDLECLANVAVGFQLSGHGSAGQRWQSVLREQQSMNEAIIYRKYVSSVFSLYVCYMVVKFSGHNLLNVWMLIKKAKIPQIYQFQLLIWENLLSSLYNCHLNIWDLDSGHFHYFLMFYRQNTAKGLMLMKISLCM